MPKSNTTTVARLITALDEIEKHIFNEALPCALHLRLSEHSELWQKLEDAGIAVKEFLNNHNAIIERVNKENQ